MTLGWAAPPGGQVGMAGLCRARDPDGQGCVHGFVHLGAHQSTGLRDWLESGQSSALIRAYEYASADRLEAMESPLFTQFGFAPIARQDLIRTESGGASIGWALVIGPLLAPTKRITTGSSASR